MGASGIRAIEFSRLDWRAATRAAVSTGAPLIVLASIDRLDLAIYARLGPLFRSRGVASA